MATQVYTFKITYADCDNRIWRTAAVSSNYTLAELGYMVLATFDTMAYHLFEMKYKNVTFSLIEEDFEDLLYDKDEAYDLMYSYKIGSRRLDLKVGDVIEIKEKCKGSERYKGILEVTGGRLVPNWLEADQENLKGVVKELPTREEIDVPVNEMLIVELYSK